MPIEDFWVWWASAGRAAAETGIGTGEFGGFTREMTKRVKAMHPDLAWELAPGGQAEHALIVTAAGVPERRRIAERWYQHARPPARSGNTTLPAKPARLRWRPCWSSTARSSTW
jgi:hypothetical protein